MLYESYAHVMLPHVSEYHYSRNKITAKFSCGSNPTLASFYSVNLTGVPRAAKEGGGLQNKTASTAAITNTNATGTS
jgi:hypothetical protein